MSSPRILAVMGSGETAPTMAKVHRALFDRFAERTVPAAIVDTPYGFQENADELSARTLEFFATSVGNPVEVASWFEAPLGFVLDPANHVHKQKEWFGRMRPYIEIDWQGHLIWGITAAIIANLSRRLAWLERAGD